MQCLRWIPRALCWVKKKMFTYVTFSKWQESGDGKQIHACRGWGWEVECVCIKKQYEGDCSAGGTVLYLDQGGTYTNIHMWSSACTHIFKGTHALYQCQCVLLIPCYNYSKYNNYSEETEWKVHGTSLYYYPLSFLWIYNYCEVIFL